MALLAGKIVQSRANCIGIKKLSFISLTLFLWCQVEGDSKSSSRFCRFISAAFARKTNILAFLFPLPLPFGWIPRSEKFFRLSTLNRKYRYTSRSTANAIVVTVVNVHSTLPRSDKCVKFGNSSTRRNNSEVLQGSKTPYFSTTKYIYIYIYIYIIRSFGMSYRWVFYKLCRILTRSSKYKERLIELVILANGNLTHTHYREIKKAIKSAKHVKTSKLSVVTAIGFISIILVSFYSFTGESVPVDKISQQTTIRNKVGNETVKKSFPASYIKPATNHGFNSLIVANLIAAIGV